MSAPRSAAGLDAHAIRRTFLDFFAAREHTVVRSSPLVPQNDPSLLFVNAGMVPFKDVFTGREQRPYQRAASAQRCLRAGGKHNDLENVGFTPRHHTLFEMLGNFSFGDYFKADAIRWAWEFLTEGLRLPASRLCVSVFSGEGEHAPYDQEAYDLWCELIPKDRIYACDAKENFWQMGDTGPCGPCSEIHLFYGGDAPPDALRDGPFGPAHEDDKYLELWNLVFMQYEKMPDGTLVALPRPSIDTGAGLERLASVCAGVPTNYETDLLRPLVDRAKQLAGVSGPQGDNEAPYQVIADHARATTFLIADGVFPDRAGRSYVLRRIMRRAIRYGTRVGLDEPFFHHMCAATVEGFVAAYPELSAAAATIDEVVRSEEEAFRRTLSRGLRRVSVALGGLDDASVFPAAVAAELYDTYGFPVDLTAVIAREKGLSLDEPAVEAEIQRRQAGDEGFRSQDVAVESVYFEIAERIGDAASFVGYDTEQAQATVRAIVVDGAHVDRLEAEVEAELVFDRTPFYAESGGQVGDAGTLSSASARFDVHDTQKLAGLHVHRGQLRSGALAVGDAGQLQVDTARRDAIRRNHSATHLLHGALRAVLGAHVTQKGSLVAPEYLRFDFSHGRPLTSDERRRVEELVNTEILANAGTTTAEMGLDAAKRAGAIGLFGEKYGERVRVVQIGRESVELCGGTHVVRAGDIGSMVITAESGIAAGVRRVEAVTGLSALAHAQRLHRVVDEAMAAAHASSSDDLVSRIDRLVGDLKTRAREIADLKRKLATGGGGAQDEVVDVAGTRLLAKRVTGADPKTLRDAADTLRDRLGSGVVVLGSDHGGKAQLLVAVTKDLAGRVHAGKLVQALTAAIGGRGGGRPDLAQAGGPEVAGLDRAIAGAAPALAAQLDRGGN
ncbi:MAG: alanine--tRNA ligase [Myxococcales bacterium FL481]|nr:MAG: alanine--tRNA ligase [Myxococcales bacterium FL481]